jgi:hypothetical protein
MVVEDCGPDPGLQSLVVSRFGTRITYHRNARRRGLFDNWNACIELCPTLWLCIVHDDDFLEPDFVEAMLELAAKIPDQGLYYGRYHVLDSAGKAVPMPAPAPGPVWQSTDVVQAATRNCFGFPADLFRVDYAKALGGFRPTSLFSADWDMWVKLTLHYGAAMTNRVVGNYRNYDAEGRATSRVDRNGKAMPLTFMQVRKNVALLRQHGFDIRFDRAAALKSGPLSTRSLLEHAWRFSPRMLAYNYRLLLQSTPPTSRYRLFQTLARWLGPRFVSVTSRLYHRLRRAGSGT